MRLTTLATIAVLLAAEAARPAAEPRALLLGLTDGRGYRTFWFEGDGAQMRLRAVLDGLRVPTASGICRLWTRLVRTTNPNYAVPGGYEHAVAGVFCDDSPGGPSETSLASGDECTGHESVEFLFVGRDHVSLQYRASGECLGRGNSQETLSMMPLAALHQRWLGSDSWGTLSLEIDGRRVLGKNEVRAVRTSAVAACVAMPQEDREILGLDACSELGNAEGPVSWHVRRGLGLWEIWGANSGCRQLGNCERLPYRVPVLPGPEVVDADAGRAPWSRILTVAPMATDAVMLGRDEALVLTDTGIFLANLKSGAVALGRRLGDRRSGERIVMERWLKGTNAINAADQLSAEMGK